MTVLVQLKAIERYFADFSNRRYIVEYFLQYFFLECFKLVFLVRENATPVCTRGQSTLTSDRNGHEQDFPAGSTG